MGRMCECVAAGKRSSAVRYNHRQQLATLLTQRVICASGEFGRSFVIGSSVPKVGNVKNSGHGQPIQRPLSRGSRLTCLPGAEPSLDSDKQAALRSDLEQLWSAHNQACDGGTEIEAEYLEAAAIRA